MIYMKSINGDVFAYENINDVENFCNKDHVKMTDAEVAEHLNAFGCFGLSSRSFIARFKRSSAISDTDWIVQRHIDEISSGSATSLTNDRFVELQEYRKELRDWPSIVGWPDIEMPNPPSWILSEKI